MTPIRIGCSWAATSLPSRLSAVSAAAEFFRSDLREVLVCMAFLPIIAMPPVTGRDAMASGQYLDKVLRSQRAGELGPHPALTDPAPGPAAPRRSAPRGS